MAVFYTGYRFVLRGQSDSDWINTYTGKIGIYSNWSLMSKEHVLDGAPNINHRPGQPNSPVYDANGNLLNPGLNFPHDVFLSRRFLGLDTKNIMDGSGKGPRVYYGNGLGNSYGPGLDNFVGDRDNPTPFHGGRFRPYEYKGLEQAFPRTGGAIPGDTIESDAVRNTQVWGHKAFRGVYYAFYVNWFFHGVPADQTFVNPGHAIRPIAVGLTQDIKDGTGPAASFGYFNPYVYKGVVSAQQDVNPGQPDTSGIYNDAHLDRDHLGGHNRVNEWIGIPAANALGTGAGRHHRGNH